MDVETHRVRLEAWLTLLRAPGIGPATLRELLRRHGDANAALVAARRGDLPHALDGAAREGLLAPDPAVIAADVAWLGQPGHELLTCDGEAFPALLHEIPSPPAALFVAGDPDLLWRPQVAIVGSRNASAGGLATVTAFARALSAAGLVVTSGLAEGIDGAAHAAALDGGGPTIAVLGTGPDLIYPPGHRGLAARIRAHGVLASEFPPGTPGHPTHFPRRNRLIAGLALGTLVVEASLRSGSLITARNATEAGREVFAVPGSIHNPLARGCHRLIRDGAKLVETAEEIVVELAPLAQGLGARLRERLADAPQAASERPARVDDPDYAKLLCALGHDALGFDQLAARTGLAVPALSSMLLMLELEGEIVAAAGTYTRRTAG